MKKLNIILVVLSGAILLACDNKEYLYKDVSSRIWLGAINNAGAPFGIDSTSTSFMLLPSTQETDTIYFSANVTGIADSRDREVRIEPVASKSNVSPGDYSIGETVIPANSFMGVIPVVVKRNVPGLDLRKERAILTLALVPNEHFLKAAVGTDTFRIIWSNYLSQPLTWYVLAPLIGNFSQAKYKFIIDVLGETEFDKYAGNISLILTVQSLLKKALIDYNNDPANQGRPEGWPYLDDDGSPLVFP